MPAFCTKCGAALASISGFCTFCGTPVPAAAFAPVAPVPPGPPVAAGYPAAPPKSSGGALKIVLIVIAVVVGLGIVAAGAVGFMAWRVARTINVDAKGNNATVSLPGIGTVTAGDSTATDADLGVPTYPGAVREKGGMNMSSAAASMVMGHFSTNDSPSQVVDFYKAKMGDGVAVVSTGSGAVINSGGPDTNRIVVTVGAGSGDDSGKTAIVIMHTMKK
jgi:hypothetical protein